MKKLTVINKRTKWVLTTMMMSLSLSSLADESLQLLPYKKIPADKFNSITGGFFESTLLPASTSVWPLRMIKADFAHQQGYKGQGIKVCLVDSGVDKNHPALADAVEEGMNFSGEGLVDDYSDNIGHGTAMATIIAGRSTMNITGVAPESKLVIAKVFDSMGGTSVDKLAKALNYCLSRAHVINLSLGGVIDQKPIEAILAQARKSGISVVAAAGNASVLTYPASDASSLAIGAVDASGLIPSFSPVSMKLSYVAPGYNVPVLEKDLSISMASGTSFSTAYTSGAEAVRMSAQKRALSGRLTQDSIEKQGRGVIDLKLTLASQVLLK